MKITLLFVASFLFSLGSFAGVEFNESNIKNYCTIKWSKRGIINNEMLEYCFRVQINGFRKASELYSNYKENVDPVVLKNIIHYSLEKWKIEYNELYQFDMLASELEKEVEAFLDIQFYIKNGAVDENKIAICRSRWITIIPNWSAIKYCIEK